MIENTTIDYKSLRKIADTQSKLKSEGLRDLAITCVAFANAQGGKIVIGIEDYESLAPNGQKINIETTNDTITRLRSLCFNVGLQLNEIEKCENGAEYFSITIHPALKSIATTADGKIYIRIGDQCQSARSEDIVRLASEKDAFQWEIQSRNILLNEIPVSSIQLFATEIRNSESKKSHQRTL